MLLGTTCGRNVGLVLFDLIVVALLLLCMGRLPFTFAQVGAMPSTLATLLPILA